MLTFGFELFVCVTLYQLPLFLCIYAISVIGHLAVDAAHKNNFIVIVIISISISSSSSW
jgi:hypothetical protein